MTNSSMLNDNDTVTRREVAAMRLPPMVCGCRDPLDPLHLDRRCRFGPRCPYQPDRRCACTTQRQASCPWIGAVA